MPQWEQNIRTLIANGERGAHYVVQCYRQDLIDAMTEVDTLRAKAEILKAAAVAALEVGHSLIEKRA
jgi:hypothetical protein